MIGFESEEVRADQPTRSARLKWVIVVLESAEPGIQSNAVACVAAATAANVTGLLGAAATDATGAPHPGLPWAGCAILTGSEEQLASLFTRAMEHQEMFVADMPLAAQTTRVYGEYLAEIGRSTSIPRLALSIVGPSNAVDRLVKRLPLR